MCMSKPAAPTIVMAPAPPPPPPPPTPESWAPKSPTGLQGGFFKDGIQWANRQAYEDDQKEQAMQRGGLQSVNKMEQRSQTNAPVIKPEPKKAAQGAAPAQRTTTDLEVAKRSGATSASKRKRGKSSLKIPLKSGLNIPV